jgi:hypothetical protein
LGPYEVTQIISPWAYSLQQSKDLYIHPVQWISRLSKTSEDLLPGQIEDTPPPVIMNAEEEYNVQHIEDSQIFRCKLQSLVKQNGYNEHSWESSVNIDRLKAIDNCHAEQPGKSGL